MNTNVFQKIYISAACPHKFSLSMCFTSPGTRETELLHIYKEPINKQIFNQIIPKNTILSKLWQFVVTGSCSTHFCHSWGCLGLSARFAPLRWFGVTSHHFDVIPSQTFQSSALHPHAQRDNVAIKEIQYQWKVQIYKHSGSYGVLSYSIQIRSP